MSAGGSGPKGAFTVYKLKSIDFIIPENKFETERYTYDKLMTTGANNFYLQKYRLWFNLYSLNLFLTKEKFKFSKGINKSNPYFFYC